ncbi:MAG: YkgJ family cysteine cluster protein [Treponemataceae bacterium]
MSECFYKNGLAFSCTQCSCCCRHEPGFVYVSQNDLEKLAAHFNITEQEFVKKYCRWVSCYKAHDSANLAEALCLNETPQFDCVFWKNGCQAYEARPVQCRTYPFWDFLLHSEASWNAEKKSCPGIGTGSIKSFEQISQLCNQYIQNIPVRKNTFEGNYSEK